MKKIEILEQQYKKLREAIDKESINETELNFLLESYKKLCMEILEELMINNADVLKRLKGCENENFIFWLCKCLDYLPAD